MERNIIRKTGIVEIMEYLNFGMCLWSIDSREYKHIFLICAVPRIVTNQWYYITSVRLLVPWLVQFWCTNNH